MRILCSELCELKRIAIINAISNCVCKGQVALISVDLLQVDSICTGKRAVRRARAPERSEDTIEHTSL